MRLKLPKLKMPFKATKPKEKIIIIVQDPAQEELLNFYEHLLYQDTLEQIKQITSKNNFGERVKGGRDARPLIK